MKVGIFGGTFDPFTRAHYEIVNEILRQKLVDKVLVIPTVVSYYRKDKQEMFDLASRKKIIERWFEGREDVVLDFYEYELAVNTSLFYDDPKELDNRRYWHMLQDIKKRYGDANEYLTIVGGDSWNNLSTWYNYEDLLISSTFIVVHRNEFALKDHVSSEHGTFHANNVVTIDKCYANVSATELRKSLLMEFSLKHNESLLDLYLKRVEKSLHQEDAEDMIDQKLAEISKVLADPYKDATCKYSIIEDIVEGKM